LKVTPNPIFISANWELSEGLIKFRKKYKFSLITVLHGLEVTRLHSQKYHKKIANFKNTLAYSDQVIAVSDYTRDEAMSISGEQGIITIPNFVDTGKFFPKSKNKSRDHFQLGHSDKILLSLSRLVKRKGHHIVIRALQIVKKEIPEINYLIAGVGDESYKNELNQLVTELGLEKNVSFLGYIDENQKVLIYNSCDVYIMNSLDTDETGDSEGFGITFLEANASGKPVIGTNVGGIPDAVENDVNGILVAPNNPQATADAIIRLFSNDAYYQKISNNAISRVNDNFSLLHIGEKYQQIISSVASNL